MKEEHVSTATARQVMWRDAGGDEGSGPRGQAGGRKFHTIT
jgi:hypothetical protein